MRRGPMSTPIRRRCRTSALSSYGFTATGPYSAADIGSDLLRRFDYVIKRDQSIAVVARRQHGCRCRRLWPVPYNSIAVGMSDATSSIGPTTIEVAGRSKPDIVAPGKFPYATPSSSYAAPKVSAAAALLVETGNNLTSNAADAVTPETIKAVLLTGATKDSLPSWSHTDTQPLDAQYGAGLLNVDNSHRILTAGEQEASSSSLVPSTGWDYDTIAADGTKNYFFDIGSSFTLDQLSITATWLRDIAITDGAGIAGSALLTPSLANIDLKLYSASGYTPRLFARPKHLNGRQRRAHLSAGFAGRALHDFAHLGSGLEFRPGVGCTDFADSRAECLGVVAHRCRNAGGDSSRGRNRR